MCFFGTMDKVRGIQINSFMNYDRGTMHHLTESTDMDKAYTTCSI